MRVHCHRSTLILKHLQRESNVALNVLSCSLRRILACGLPLFSSITVEYSNGDGSVLSGYGLWGEGTWYSGVKCEQQEAFDESWSVGGPVCDRLSPLMLAFPARATSTGGGGGGQAR